MIINIYICHCPSEKGPYVLLCNYKKTSIFTSLQKFSKFHFLVVLKRMVFALPEDVFAFARNTVIHEI